MFEEYLEKKVKLLAQVGDELLTFTCTIKEVSPTHIKILDKFGEEHLLLIENVQQAKPIEEAGT